MPYTIVGIDGKEYGPVGLEDLRRWIAEGRLNGQSLAKGEGDAEFHPLSQFPEFADALAQQAPPTPGPSGPPSPVELVARDYNLSIDGCLGAGWRLVKNNFWPAVGASFLITLVVIVLNQMVGLITRPTVDAMIHQHHFTPGGIFLLGSISIAVAPVHVLLFAGLYMFFLKLIRGQPATLGDAFSGFGPFFGQLLLLGWVQALLVIVGAAFCIIPGIYLSVAWAFATPLVIDREMGFWEAMELSRRVVSKHWFVVFAFVIVYSLVIMAGIIACCIGIFVTIPIGIASLMCGYEYLFSRRQN